MAHRRKNGLKEDALQMGHPPKLLYKLIVMNNEQRVTENGDPHIILKRAVRGADGEPITEKRKAEQLKNNRWTVVVSDEEEKVTTGPEINTSSVDVDTAIIKDDEQSDQFANATEVSNYLASLSHHVPDDVRRVVEAIIAEEETVSDNGPKDAAEIDPEALAERDSGQEQQVDLGEIFNTLKKARKQFTQKKFKYTKKVEYEDL